MISLIPLRYLFSLFFLSVLLLGCGPSSKQPDQETETINNQEVIKRDLDKIRASGKLKALTSYSSTSYFIYRGRPMGYEYELLKRLAQHLELELEIIVVENMDSIIQTLNRGEGDIISHGLTITKERTKSIAFTKYHTKTHQVLVQRKPDNWRKMKLHNIRKQLIRDPLELIGKEVHVRKNSSYYSRLLNLSEEIGGDINIVTVPGDLETEELIKMVADGEIEYTVADYNIAAINSTYYTNLDIKTKLSFNQRIAWAVRPNSFKLLQEVNDWIVDMRKTNDYYTIYNKYFKNRKAYRRRVSSDYFSLAGNKISVYDDLIRRNAERIGWDWRLLASVVYQESKFRPRSVSWAGAQGLMQMMPETAREFGVTDPFNPADNVKGGTNYLSYIYEQWSGIPDSLERIKFTLASYNIGIGHILDAQRLAEKYDSDPRIWTDNVENYILLKSKPEYYNDPVVRYGYCRGSETYNYVRTIFDIYRHYVKFVLPEESFIEG